MNRKRVYEIIDTERDYQENLPATRTDGREHTVGEFLVMGQYYLDQAIAAWTMNAGDEAALEQIRKLAGICVNCMEKHGAKPRSV